MKNKIGQAGRRSGRPRVLILGCGDVARRMLPWLTARCRVFAVTTDASHVAALREAGAIPLVANLDDRASLQRLAGLAHWVIHSVPPSSQRLQDLRSRNACAILPERARLVYISTSGVYGDCGGNWVDETRPVHPQNARAIRRVSAEKILRGWARRRHSRLAIVRAPGIYANDRWPLERLQKGTPVLTEADDVYTNHIHADDLANILMRALFRGRPNRVYHACDDSDLKMGDYFGLVANHFGLSVPPRLPAMELQQAVTATQWSFMAESRRLRNNRIKHELGVRLRYSTVAHALARSGIRSRS